MFIFIVSWYFCFSYNGAITKCVTAIIVLERKCKEYQNDADKVQPAAISHTPVVMGPPPRHVRALHGPGTGNSSRSSSNETEQEVGRTFLRHCQKKLKRLMKCVFLYPYQTRRQT